jgi:hypothetical protein
MYGCILSSRTCMEQCDRRPLILQVKYRGRIHSLYIADNVPQFSGNLQALQSKKLAINNISTPVLHYSVITITDRHKCYYCGVWTSISVFLKFFSYELKVCNCIVINLLLLLLVHFFFIFCVLPSGPVLVLNQLLPPVPSGLSLLLIFPSVKLQALISEIHFEDVYICFLSWLLGAHVSLPYTSSGCGKCMWILVCILVSSTSASCSVGIVRSWTKGHGVCFVCILVLSFWTYLQ